MKKKKLLFIPLALSFLLVGCGPSGEETENSSESPASSSSASSSEATVTITLLDEEGKSAGTLFIGETLSLIVSTTNVPSGESVTLASSDASIASVTSAGKVTALKAGKATISASFGAVKAEYEVTVPAKTIVIEGEGAVKVGATINVKAVTAGTKATDFVWTSDNEEVATVVGNDENATITGVKAGKANIKVTLGDVDTSLEVVVTNVDVEGVSILHKEEIGALPLRRTLQLEAAVSPDNATFKNVTWESDHPEIASVSENGLVTGEAMGVATITAKAGEKSDSVTVTIGAPVIKAEEINNLPASYAAKVTRTYDKELPLDGTLENPYSFETEETTIGTGDNIITLPMMTAKVDYFPATGSAGCNIRFTINEPGKYMLFSYGGYVAGSTSDKLDPKIANVYSLNESGETTVLSGTMNDDYGSGTNATVNSKAFGGKYCATTWDFCLEQTLEPGNYIANLTLGYNKGDYKFGIVNVSTDEDGAMTIGESATGYPTTVVTNDNYAFHYLQGSTLFEDNLQGGLFVVDDTVRELTHKPEEDEYVYDDDASELSVAQFTSLYSWESLLTDSAFVFEGTNDDGDEDTYVADLTAIAEDSSIAAFVGSLGIEDELLDKMSLTINVTDGTAALGIKFAGATDFAPVTIEEIDALPEGIVITHHNVNNGGVAGSDSGIDQEW